MQYSNDLINQIRDRSDILDIIGEVVELHRKGGNYFGRCPFHNEKTPSFSVSPERGIYKCFGCGAAGSVVTFMMKYHGLSFQDSIKELARRAGIVIPTEFVSAKTKEKLTYDEQLLNSLFSATTFFQQMLGTTAGKIATAYLSKRGFSPKIIESFQLGYSPDSFNALTNHLEKQGFSQKVLLDAGLLVENKEKNTIYDRFRNRLMFPIHNSIGKIIAFGARQLTDEPDQPKYINSPQTQVYDKSRVLYGYFQAKNEIRAKKFAILAEGYADVISLHEGGFRNAVASSGTSLTREQLDLLLRICSRIYISYDSDNAGLIATQRALEMALEKGFDTRIVCLPDGEDPDSMIKKYGQSIYQKYLDEAVSFVEFRYNQLKKQNLLSSPQERTTAARELLRLISKIPDRLQHDEYLSQLADLFKFTGSQVQKLYEEKKDFEKAQARSNAGASQSIESSNTAEKTTDTLYLPVEFKMSAEEKMILSACLDSSDVIAEFISSGVFNANLFFSPDAITVFNVIEPLIHSRENIINTIFENEDIPLSIRDFLTTLVMSSETPSDRWERFGLDLKEIDLKKGIMDAVFKLELRKLDIESEILKNSLKNSSAEEQEEILIKLHNIKIKKCKLESGR